jgi:uncharacterized protein (TIGR03435 family)
LRVGSLLLSVALAPWLAGAQAPVAPQIANAKPPVYDVVSIRLDDRGPGSTGTNVNAGAYTATNVTMKDLLEQAYDIREDLIQGVPGSLDSIRFDVLAKIIDPDLDALLKLTDPQRRAMLMPILADRFHLQARIEMKNLPVYELILLKGGPKFHPSPDQAAHNESTSVYNTALKLRDMPIPIFAKTLAHQLNRTVVDKTGLTGIYDLDLKWSRDDVANPDPNSNAPPTFFTAIQEQLGLKLQPAKGPVKTLVVDHIEMPSGN